MNGHSLTTACAGFTELHLMDWWLADGHAVDDVDFFEDCDPLAINEACVLDLVAGAPLRGVVASSVGDSLLAALNHDHDCVCHWDELTPFEQSGVGCYASA